MIDREKVIKGTEICLSGGKPDRCRSCPYHLDGCDRQRMLDTLALLKKQEAKPIAYTDNPYTGLPVARCPNCGKFARQFDMAIPDEETHFCPWCGQAVKWDEV